MIKKVLCVLCLTVLVNVSFISNVQAVNIGSTSQFSVEVSEKNTSENNTKISGVIPSVKGSSELTKKINSRIDEIYSSIIKVAASDRAKEVVFDYKKYENENYISFVILYKTINATEKNEVATINVDVKNQKIIDLSEYANSNKISIDIINKYVSHYKSNIKVEYNSNFSNITANSNFYINNEKLYLIFNLGDFKTNARGTDILHIPYNDFEKYVLSEKEFYLSDSFKTKMIPLRQILEVFDYKVGWDNKSKDITATNGDTISVINSKSDTYILNRKSVQLENKPEIVNGVTYVPLSYFSDILGVPYYVYEQGIIFYKF